MKKLLLVLFTICMLLSGCAKKEEETGNAGLAFDKVDYSTIEEMNKAASTNIKSIAVAGKSDEAYCVISGNLAQYTFKVNGEEWCIRASKDVDNDISGLYYDNIGFEKDVEATYYNDEVYAHRFFYNDTQYVISVKLNGKDIETRHFDDVCADIQTNITGVQAGYDTQLLEEGNDVIYRVTMYNADGSTTVMDSIYTFDGDTMVSISSKISFETEDDAKAYYDELIENGSSSETLTLDGNTIISNSSSADFYEDMSKEEFISMMKASLGK